MRRLIPLALFIASLTAFAQPPGAVTTVIVVRHAEKAGGPGDVPLSDTGRIRADELGRVLTGAKVTAIYATQFLRSRQTTTPIARALHLEPVIIATSATYARDLARHIRKENSGGTVLVISDADRIGEVLKQLGVQDPLPPMGKTQYDDLFVVTLGGGVPAKLLALRFGDPAR